MASPHPALTYDRQLAIMRRVQLGAPVPDGETPAEKEWRLACEEEVKQYRRKGAMLDLPFDP